ncbi:MAG: CoA transferase [Rhodospirillales bacterium]|nr:CoA transferase [Rhodospirillales bacterium]
MLAGFRVLDLTQFVAGPTCTRLLAEFGAEVIKIELAPGGDRGRNSGDKPRDPAHRASSTSTYFFQHNHSKKSLAIDIKSARGRDLVLALAARSDVAVENFAPGVMDRAGLGYAALSAVNPRLVMCSISLAGQTGPLSAKPGFDYMGAAYAGITAALGEPDRGPTQIPMAIGDSATGVTAAMAIAVALMHRERGGGGQHIDCSLLDTYFNMHEVNVPKTALRGADFAPPRAGSLHPDGGPTGVFRCPDGSAIAIMVMPHQWQAMVAAMGMPDLATDPRFATPRARRDNNAALAAIIEGWIARFPTREAAIAALEAERIPCAPVLTLAEAMAHPHLRARRTVRAVRDKRLGAFDIPGLAAKFSAWPERETLRAPLLGEDNEAVLRDVLGLGKEAIADLHRSGVLVRDPELG